MDGFQDHVVAGVTVPRSVMTILAAASEPEVSSTVHFSDEELANLTSALKAGKLAIPTWESSEAAKGEWGISSAWMKEAKRVWEEEFDW